MAGEPYRPATPNAVLAQLPPGQTDLDRLRARLSQHPEDLPLALDLAERYMRLGSAESDPRYYAYARAALEPWWERPNPPVEVLVFRGIYHQHQHEFATALRDFEQAVQRDPRHAQAWLSRAMVLRVQGEYAAAAAACQPLFKLAGPAVSMLCLAGVNSLSGRLEMSYHQLDALARRPMEPVLSQWLQTELAQMAQRLGQSTRADAHYRAALDIGERDVYLISAYADFLLDSGRNTAARALLADELQIDGLLLRLAIAERRLNDRRWREHADLLARRFAASARRGGTLHLREQARSLLELEDDPTEALQLALENWRIQREPADARLVLEAARAAGEAQAATPVLAWLDRTGLEDVRLDRLRQQLEARDA